MKNTVRMTNIVSGGMLYVHSAGSALRRHIEWDIARTLQRDVELQWQRQPKLVDSWRTELRWDGAPGMGARLASAPAGCTRLSSACSMPRSIRPETPS